MKLTETRACCGHADRSNYVYARNVRMHIGTCVRKHFAYAFADANYGVFADADAEDPSDYHIS